MKQLAHTYCLFALVVTSISVFVFRKMDKTSFYHHYFKVIEEVELRNSQEIETAPGIWQVAKAAMSRLWNQVFQWFSGLLVVSLSLVLGIGSWLRLSTPHRHSLVPQAISLSLHPPRAP